MSSQPPWSEDTPPWQIDDTQIPGYANAVKGAVERSNAPAFDWTSLAEPGMRAANIGMGVGLPAAGLAVAGPVAVAGGALGAWGGGKVGRELGSSAGRLAGYPKEGSNIGELAGTLIGGGLGGATGSAGMSTIAKLTPHSRAGILARILSGLEADAPAAAGAASKQAANPLEDTIQALMKGESNLGKMDRTTAEELAKAISQQAGRNAAPAATKAVDVAGDVAKATRTAEIAKAVPSSAMRAGARAAGPAPEAAQGLILQVQQMISQPGGKEAVRRWLATQSEDVVAQIKPLLERGAASMPTTRSGLARSTGGPKLPAGFGEELAQMLGQSPPKAPGASFEQATKMVAAEKALGKTITNVETPLGQGVVKMSGGEVIVSDPVSGSRLYNMSPEEYRSAMKGGMFKPSEAGTPITVYHGTTAKGLRPEPGLHVGTTEQAGYRASLGRDPITGELPEGAKVFPLKIAPKKIIDITDLGNAMGFPGNKAEELVRVGALTQAEAKAALASPSPTKKIYEILKAKGYDAIRYGNQWEGAGKSYEIIDPAIVSGRYGGKIFG